MSTACRILFPTGKRGRRLHRVNASQFAQPTLRAIVKINWYMRNRQIPTAHRGAYYSPVVQCHLRAALCVQDIYEPDYLDVRYES